MKTNIKFTLLFLLLFFGKTLLGQSDRDSLYSSPTMMSSWNGGQVTDKEMSFQYQTVSLFCHSFVFKYKNLIEINYNYLLRSSFGIIE